ncbi:gamma-gliadin-like [Aplysia californica]|uniref:Gamma-gliadin-like n=1 Tax=Aplysia californica TaxID=6500 RepID=A0ABM0JTT4_APLCA|nr:gamma-gliadin-like [Aplysia californica]
MTVVRVRAIYVVGSVLPSALAVIFAVIISSRKADTTSEYYDSPQSDGILLSQEVTPHIDEGYPHQSNELEPPQHQYYPEHPQHQYYPEHPQHQYYPEHPQQQYYPEPPQQQYYPEHPQQQYYPGPPQQQYYPEPPQQQYYPEPPQQQYYPEHPQEPDQQGTPQQQYYPEHPQQQYYYRASQPSAYVRLPQDPGPRQPAYPPQQMATTQVVIQTSVSWTQPPSDQQVIHPGMNGQTLHIGYSGSTSVLFAFDFAHETQTFKVFMTTQVSQKQH